MMTRVMKRLISVTVATVVILMAVPFSDVSAEIDGDFEYTVTDGIATITAYNGTATELMIPDILGGYPVGVIGDEAFYNNDVLTRIVVSDTVTTIGTKAFCSCNDLEDVILGKSVTHIGGQAFKYCGSFHHLVIPSSVKTIGDLAFDFGSGWVKNLYYGGSSSDWRKISIGSYNNDLTLGTEYYNIVDYGVHDHFYYVATADGAAIIGYNGTATELAIPDTINGHTLTAIGSWAFARCNTLTTVEIPDSVTEIRLGAFTVCDNLESIVIPDNVTYLGEGAFYNSDKLETVTLSKNLTTIEPQMFFGCSALKNVTIPEGVTAIGYYGFYGCENLKSMVIPDGVTEIGSEAFNWCDSLSNVTFGKSVETIKYGAFANAIGLTSVVLPDSVKTIDERAFSKCTALKRVIMSDGVETIGEEAFNDCGRFDNLYFTGSEEAWNAIAITEPNESLSAAKKWFDVEKYGEQDGMFYIIQAGNATITEYDGSAQALDIPATLDGCPVVAVADHAFEYGTTLADITLPDSAIRIGSNVFDNTAYYQNEANWENGVLYIGKHLIAAKPTLRGNCTVRSDTITIADSAFYGCGELRSVMFGGSVIVVGDDVFSGCDNLVHIFFTGTKSQWKAINTAFPVDTVTYHYAVTEDTLIVDADEVHCYECGDVRYGCTVCDTVFYTDVDIVAPDGYHTFSGDNCKHCGIALSDYMCSAHPYAGNTDETKMMAVDGAESVELTFSDQTYVEEDYDFIYIYDKNDVLVGTYTGNQLAGTTVTVNGNIVKVRLVSDNDENGYGYALERADEPAPVVVLGDVDGDGEMTTTDARVILFAVVTNGVGDFTQAQRTAADLNGDGCVDSTDARLILLQLVTV